MNICTNPLLYSPYSFYAVFVILVHSIIVYSPAILLSHYYPSSHSSILKTSHHWIHRTDKGKYYLYRDQYHLCILLISLFMSSTCYLGWGRRLWWELDRLHLRLQQLSIRVGLFRLCGSLSLFISCFIRIWFTLPILKFTERRVPWKDQYSIHSPKIGSIRSCDFQLSPLSSGYLCISQYSSINSHNVGKHHLFVLRWKKLQTHCQ